MKAFGKTHKGMIRKNNEDTILCKKGNIGIFPNVFIVADGMGGHLSGEVASKYAVKLLFKYLKNNRKDNKLIENLEVLLKNAVEYVNQQLYILSQKKEKLKGMGTTFVVCMIKDETLYVANVGDSRAYLLNEKEITRITNDHSFIEELIRNNGVSREEAEIVTGKNILTQALGMKTDISVDVFTIKLEQNSYVLMCSDGLTNMLQEKEILNIYLKESNTNRLVRKLIKKANENGGKDNISVIVIDI